MERLLAYFQGAKVCGQNRKLGIETETLFVDVRYQPISYLISQGMMQHLRDVLDWQVAAQKNGVIVRLEKAGFAISYELGWNNFELTTPAYDLAEDVFREHDQMLKELYQAGEDYAAQPLAESAQGSWDHHFSDTLMIPDQRDKIWLKLDGEALFGLGHIAAVHFNLDLKSIPEGMAWIRKLNHFFVEAGWPPPYNLLVWRKYIQESLVGYDEKRYGPAPDDFGEYCHTLSSFAVVMERQGKDLHIANPPLPFYRRQNPDIDLFLRSVWWYPRLRVRNGNLVLEIRDVPRGIEPRESFRMIREVLAF